MENWLLLLFSLAVGAAGGLLLYKLKVPAGMIMGAMIAVAAVNIFIGKMYLPSPMRTMTQILAGGYIATTVTKEDIKRFPRLVKAYLLVILSYLLLNFVCGVIIRLITPNISFLTALFCCVPGGMTDIPIISAEMGADVTKVAAMQFVRLVIGFVIFPSLISVFIKKNPGEKTESTKRRKATGTVQDLLITLAIAAAAGILGKMTGIPAGTILFSVVAVIIYKLLGGRTFIPVWIRRIAQVLTGVYIGT
ncbi:MAG: AbrB family transcriptional regulator, partial [Clostridia bacterium]|nr:AbrB family transcriptional regulator [Clostridia bacterium]